MPRTARIIIPDYPHHVVQRGHDRRACFFCDDDRRFYLEQLTREGARCGCLIHAYVLMTNHVHLLATPSTPDALSEMMRAVNLRLTPRINRREGRRGTLWESRFKSAVVDSDEYLLACYKYIEFNPVRAGMVDQPRRFPWSSHGANAGQCEDPLVTPHALYDSLACSAEARQRIYTDLFTQDLSRVDYRAIRTATAAERPIGGDAFKARVGSLVGRNLLPKRRGGRREGAGRPGGRRKQGGRAVN